MGVVDVLKSDFSVMLKHTDEKKMLLDIAWLAWDKHLREASLKAVKDNSVEWDDNAHKALDFLLERFLKPKA